MRARTSFALVMLVAAGAACSGGDDASEAPTAPAATTGGPTTVAATEPPTPPAPTTAPPTTAPPTTQPATTASPTTAPATTAPATTMPTDPLAAIAAGALLTVDDLPQGWTEQTPEGDDEGDDEASAIVAACADVDALLVDDDVLGTSRVEVGFASPDESLEFEQSAGFAADEAAAAAAAAAVGDPDIPGCYAQAVTQFFEDALASTDPADTVPPGMEIGEVTSSVGDLSGFALQADDASWFHIQYPLMLQGQTFEQHADFVFLRNGAALSRLMLTGFGATFPADGVQAIVELADARLAAIA